MAQTKPDAFQHVELYDRVLAAVSEIPPGQLPLESGFVDDAPDRVEASLWRPVGTLPDRWVNAAGVNTRASAYRFAGRLIIGIKGGGFGEEWERRVFRGTTQWFDVVLDGTVSVAAGYEYDGGDTWSYLEVPLPDGVQARDLRAVEIERSGALLFSAYLPEETPAPTVRANVNFITHHGAVSGWATSERDPAEDVFLEVRAGDQKLITRTAGLFFDSGMRRFDCHVGHLVREGDLLPVSVRDLTTGREADRSPIALFRNKDVFFYLAGASLDGGALRATLRTHKLTARKPLSLAARGASGFDVLCEVNEEDPAEFRYLEGHNSFNVPLERLAQAEQVLLIENGRDVIGTLPSLDTIAAAFSLR